MPQAIGPYRLLRRLGRGGMGVVYRAEHFETGERVALKTVRLPDHAMLASIRREIHALRRINHPGVVRIVAEGLADGVPWYAMELLEGRTLRDFNTPAGLVGVPVMTTVSADASDITVKMNVTEPCGEGDTSALDAPRRSVNDGLMSSLGIIRKVCETLAYVHGLGLVHRDLKPDNVFVRESGMPVIVDFGLALPAPGANPRDEPKFSGRPVGSPAYMAPEQIRGELADARADLYAVGCILYEVVTGRVPFSGSVQAVITRQLHELAPAPSEIVPSVPAALDELILKLLQKRPQDRYGHADDVAAALGALGAEGFPSPPRGRPYLYRPGLSGRASPMAQVEKSIVRALGKRGTRILVGGESGVGKTRFAMELATLASRRGLRVITGECAPVSTADSQDGVRAGPLHPFRNLLHAVADRCREHPDETERLLGERGRVLAVYEPSILRLPGQSRYPELPVLPAQASRARLVSALDVTLATFALTEPTLLLLDDLQWADESSLAFLNALSADWFARTPVILLGTYRTEEKSRAIEELTSAPFGLSLELGRLSGEAVGQMVSDMLAMASPPPGFVEYLVEQSEGNPFFIAEYLRAAIDERLLVRDEHGAWRVVKESAAPSSFRESLPLPRRLRVLVGSRVAALSKGARAVARVASVLGREFDAEVLDAATTLGDLPVLEAVEELRARQILDVAGERLRFVHDKVREIIFSEIPEDKRRALSGVAAHAIEARYGGTPEIAGYYPILAHRYAAAREHDKALEYLEKAGERALETGASAEAVGFLRRAAELDDDRRARGDEPLPATRRGLIERRLGQAEYNLGHLREAEQHTRAALDRLSSGRLLRSAARLRRARAGHSREPGAVTAFLVLMAHLAQQMFHLVGPARRVTQNPEERRSLTEASLAAERLGEIYFFQNEPLLSFSAALRAANLAERLGPSPELARSYASLSIAFGLVPLQRVVDAYEARARAAADATSDPQAISWVHSLVGLSAIGTARWDKARSSLDKAIELARVVQDHRRAEECLALRGNVELMTGACDAAMRYYDELMTSASRSGDHQGEIWALCGRTEALMVLGQADEALLLMERAHQLMKDDRGDASLRVTRGEGAFVHYMRGDRERARRVAMDTLELMVRLSPSAFHLINGYNATCEVLLGLCEQERSREERARLARDAQRACRAMRGYARVFPIGRPYALRYAGWLDAIAGRAGGAARGFAQSLAEAERLGMPIEAALARYEMGRHLPSSDPARLAHLARARAAFEELGMSYWLSRADALLERAESKAVPVEMT